jgi:hypothetical protein
VERKEGDADEKCHKHTSLLELLVDEQHHAGCEQETNVASALRAVAEGVSANGRSYLV